MPCLPDAQIPHITVVGSLNVDLVLRAPRCAQAGETLLGHDFAIHPGGKGANQAIACARMGQRVCMVGKTGNDTFAQTLRQTLQQAGVDQVHVLTAEGSSGVAMILVEDSGQNRIMLAPGANHALGERDILHAADCIQSAALVICQLEVPMDCVRLAFELARKAHKPILFNPAPAVVLPADMVKVDYLILNETEAEVLCGIAIVSSGEARAAARQLRRDGADTVILTLGAQGVLIADQNGERQYAAHPVHVVDTTAAGDTFIGGFAAGLREGMQLDRAVALGQAAAALCVTRKGAQPSIPFRHEIAIN
jgi:ribokinase